MNFEEALNAELEAVTGFSGKVFPMMARGLITPPLAIYRKSNIEYLKVLSGFLTKIRGTYQITIIETTYEDLQTRTQAVTDKILTFLDRTIGTEGPHIEGLSLNHLGEGFDKEAELFSAVLQLEVKY